MNAFPDWFTRDAEGFDPVLKAGIAHLWLVTIHPFEDGNVGAVAFRTVLRFANGDELPIRAKLFGDVSQKNHATLLLIKPRCFLSQS